MITINHVINPFKCEKDNSSYLYYAQPITFKSMNIAKNKANKEIKNLNVKIFAINYLEDDSIIPKYFRKLNHLKRSTKDLYDTNIKLPFIQDILDGLYNNTNSDYIIFTNSDISLKPNFYKKVYNIIKNEKRRSFTINRRDNIPKFFINNSNKKVYFNESHLNILNNFRGELHPGNDCFVIHKSLLKKINLKNLFIGYPPWGTVLVKVLEKLDSTFKIYKNLMVTYHLGKDRQWKKNVNILKSINHQNTIIVKNKYNIK